MFEGLLLVACGLVLIVISGWSTRIDEETSFEHPRPDRPHVVTIVRMWLMRLAGLVLAAIGVGVFVGALR